MPARANETHSGSSKAVGGGQESVLEALRLVHVALGQCGKATKKGQELNAAELLAALTTLRHLRDELATWEPQLITAARALGASWASLAPALGVASRQAAERRYLRLQPSPTGETTGEARVRAERGKRAAERTVIHWARQNSGMLRKLAGQVSALENLDTHAQQKVDLVAQALADNDAARLIAPLAEVHSQLERSYPMLAQQISRITNHIHQLRANGLGARKDGV